MMKRLRNNDERGQSMVLIALVFVGLAAFLALVTDGGMAFAIRRQMQNAADAGALAGVRKLFPLYYCSHTDADEDSILEAVHKYAETNGVEDTHPLDPLVNDNVTAYFIDENYPTTHTPIGVALPGNDGIPAGAVGVEVTTSGSFLSFFAAVIGREELGASAVAASILTKEACMGPYVVWADSYDPTCGLDMTGSSIDVTGSVHSNSDAHLTGTSVNISGAIEYCLNFVGSHASFGSLNPWPPEEWCDEQSSCIPRPWETLNIDINRFSDPDGDLRAAAEADTDDGCDGTIAGVEQTSCYHSFSGHFKPKHDDDPLPDGLYYVDGDVHIKGTDLPPGDAHITIVATGTIRMEQMGANDIIAYSDLDGQGATDLLLFSNEHTYCQPWAIDISSSGTEWKGLIFAPYGKISISSSDITTLDGAVWGYSVNLSGSTQVVGWSADVCENVDYVTSPSVFLAR